MKFNWNKCTKDCKQIYDNRICLIISIDFDKCTADGKECEAIENENNLQIK